MSCQSLIRHIQPDGFFKYKMLAIHIGRRCHPAFFLTGDHHRREEPLCIVMQCLPSSIVIDGRPGNHRPAVIQLPVDGAHTASTIAPEMLHSVADCIRLLKLRSIDKAAEVLRIPVRCLHIMRDLAVGTIVSLMLFHLIRERIHLMFIPNDRLKRFNRWEGLKSELRRIAEKVIPILGKRLITVPDLPIMHIAPVIIIWCIKGASGRRTRRPVECNRIVFFQNFRNNALIHKQIISHLRFLRYPRARCDKHLHLVISAP